MEQIETLTMAVKEMEAHSAGSKDVGGVAAVAHHAAAAAVPDSAVEGSTQSVSVFRMDSAPHCTEGEAAAAAVVAVAAAATETLIGLIHSDLQVGDCLQILGG